MIPLHSWYSRVDNPDSPDWMVFDLDPHQVAFTTAREPALRLKDLLNREGGGKTQTNLGSVTLYEACA